MKMQKSAVRSTFGRGGANVHRNEGAKERGSNASRNNAHWGNRNTIGENFCSSQNVIQDGNCNSNSNGLDVEGHDRGDNPIGDLE